MYQSAGSLKRPLFKADGTTCIGVETVDGSQYFADKVILAAGAWSPALVDLEDQCCSKVIANYCQVNIASIDTNSLIRPGSMHTCSLHPRKPPLTRTLQWYITVTSASFLNPTSRATPNHDFEDSES